MKYKVGDKVRIKSIDWAFFHKNNCFQNKEEAQIYADKIKELLKE